MRVLFATESECGSFQSTLTDLVQRQFDVFIEPTERFARVEKTNNHKAILSLHYSANDNENVSDY